MDGAAQRDCAAADASGSPSGIRHSAGTGQFGAIQAVAPSFGVELSPLDVHDRRRDRALPSQPSRAVEWRPDRDRRARRRRSSRSDHRARGPAPLPAVYSERSSSPSGGLISYGADCLDQYRQAAALCRPHPQGREARRSAGAGADQVRAGRSTSRPRRRSASTCRRRCSPAPTR